MGVFIFLIAVVVEFVFAVFCIITKSNQEKIRGIIRIGAFAGFALLTILTIVDWSFRYYAVAVVLLMLGVRGLVTLIRKEEEKTAYKGEYVISKAIGMTLIIFIVTLPAIIFPQYEKIKPTGEYQVATKTYTYTDTERAEIYTNIGENRKLNVELWYPKNAPGKYPLIVFSHGSFGIKTSNESLFNELASHGYVVCSIDHTYQCLFTTDEDGNTTWIDKSYMQEVFEQDAHSHKQQSYDYFQKWMKIRTGDINFVIDHILAEVNNSDVDRAYKLVDTTKIGVMGHSLGGSAALGIGRMRGDVSGVIALESPFMCDIEGVKDNQLVFTDKDYPVPVLNVYSDSSWNHLGQWPQYAENYALLANTNASAFNVHIRGAGHLTLTDLALTSPFLTRIFNQQKSTIDTEHCLKTINKLCLEFFDSYLKK
jgi:dienelactone hydrolase/NADH:ubiquinone oxidoreductase subunit 6 (subunit J)